MELVKWEGTLRGARRTTAGAKPYTMKVVRTVFNGGHEETYGNATRLVPTRRLTPDGLLGVVLHLTGHLQRSTHDGRDHLQFEALLALCRL